MRGSLQPCKSCATGEANQKKIMKTSEHVTATNRNERVFLDIFMINKLNNGIKVALTKKKWRIVVEKFSGMKFSNLYDTKNGMIEPICEIFKNGNKMTTR